MTSAEHLVLVVTGPGGAAHVLDADPGQPQLSVLDVGATRGDTLRMRGRLPLTHLHNRLCTPHASTPIIGPGMRF